MKILHIFYLTAIFVSANLNAAEPLDNTQTKSDKYNITFLKDAKNITENITNNNKLSSIIPINDNKNHLNTKISKTINSQNWGKKFYSVSFFEIF